MRNHSFLQYILLFLLAFIYIEVRGQETPPVESGPQEEPIQEEAQLERWQNSFKEAERVFNSENQPTSIALFQDLIAQITEQKIKRPLIQPEKDVLLRSLDYLGQAFYLEGQQDQASSVFLKLIELDPNYRLNPDEVSIKIIDFVTEIRNQNLGALKVTSDPPGATVKLDGVEIGKTDLLDVYSLKGPHEIEITKPGYSAQTMPIAVTPGKVEKLAFTLERNAAAAYFITYPKDVEVFVNGKRIGVTGGEALPEKVQQAATESGKLVTDFTEEFVIPDLQPGVYEVEFRKPCWETNPRKITIEKYEDYQYTPIVMVPSFSYLNITSNDPQGTIFIDEEYKGMAPKEGLQVCSGKHAIKIKGPLGKFEQKVELKKDQTLAINAKLNPSLAFLGVTGSVRASSADVTRYSEEAVRELSTLTTLNFQNAITTSTNEVMQQIVQSLGDNKPDAQRKAKIQETCDKLESDLLLIGYLPDDHSERGAEFYLFSHWSSVADIRLVKLGDAQGWKTLKSELDFEFPLSEKRLGVNFIDTTITSGPVASRIPLRTSDAASPLLVGDVVTSIEGKTVATAAELLAAAKGLQSAEQVTLSVQRIGATTSVPVRMVRSPVELPENRPDILYNRQMAAFKKILGLEGPNQLDKNMAQLNLGLAYIHFAEYEDAITQLQLVKLDRAVGIGPGTVKYRLALCYRELGRKTDAQAALADASKSPENTLMYDDGPPLARELERTATSLR